MRVRIQGSYPRYPQSRIDRGPNSTSSHPRNLKLLHPSLSFLLKYFECRHDDFCEIILPCSSLNPTACKFSSAARSRILNLNRKTTLPHPRKIQQSRRDLMGKIPKLNPRSYPPPVGVKKVTAI